MELKWDSAPVTDPGPFSRDIFDKFTLAPTIKELWAILQSPDVKPDVKEENKIKPEVKRAKNKKPTSQTPTSNSNGTSESPTDCKTYLSETNEEEGFLNPKVPYPRHSSLCRNDRVTCLFLLRNKLYRTGSPTLMAKVKEEVAEFMKYLQDVSKLCADDYNYMPLGAARYLEEYFKHCLDRMKYYPRYYSIQEITSLSGGKFVSDISLIFEKQLLAMGTIEMVEKRVLSENTQLSVDYDSVSSVIPPIKKASYMHTPISSDTNAEKLSATYEPHVCLAKEAFIQLLNNSGTFTEAWELPVYVKANPPNGSSHSKTVYIDPPLLKTEMTCRERNQLIHEESIKLAYKKTGSNPVFLLASEYYTNGTDFVTLAKSSRAVVSFDSNDIDFEVDVTDLESFGESCKPRKKLKDNTESQTSSKSKVIGSSKVKVGFEKDTSFHTPTEGASTPKENSLASSTPPKQEVPERAVKTDVEDCPMDESTESALNSATEEEPLSNTSIVDETSVIEHLPAKRRRPSSASSSVHAEDSDEERLIIDDPHSPLECRTEKETPLKPQAQENITEHNTSVVSETSADTNAITSPISVTKGAKKGAKRARPSVDGDQLGHILRMQNAMLKSTTSKCPEPLKTQTPDSNPPEQKTTHHSLSLVKPSVTAYLESREGMHSEAVTPASSQPTAQRKRLLREELWLSMEDEQYYEAPQEGSVLYKLYSLLDVLLMVRSTVTIAHPRHDQDVFRAVPVHVLPKLEYQLCYGVESLSHTEACQLWGEQLLNSSTVSFIGRINAHTSKVVQLQELNSDWMQDTICDFKPARCLNTLHHILKKVMSLQEGRYMLSHKSGEAFLSILKETDGKKSIRSVYDVQEVHCGLPVVPVIASVPFVPVDPYHIMPFHQKYCRPPCTFPPRPPPQPKKPNGGKGANPAKPGPSQGTQPSSGTPSQNWKKKKNNKRNKKPNPTT